MLTCYVASAGVELDRARRAMTALRMSGLVRLALDWTQGYRPIGELSDADRARLAREDHEAIRRSDVVLVLAPTVRSDALVEMGLALGMALACPSMIRLVVAGPVQARGIFAALGAAEGVCVEVESDADGIAAVLAMAREGR